MRPATGPIRAGALVVLLCACFALAGCLTIPNPFHRKGPLPQPAPPPPPTAQAPATIPLQPSPDSLPVPPQPKVEAPKAAAPERAQQSGEEPEPQPAPQRRTRRSSPKTAQSEPALEEQQPAAPAVLAPAPRAELPTLGAVLDDDQRREYLRAIDGSLATAEQNLQGVRARKLNSRQKTMLTQAESFVRQARDARESDPVTAKSLAERADLLSRELVASSR